MRITNNIYLLSGGFYCGGEYGALGNVYGIRTVEGMILIDCGLPEYGLKMIQQTMDYYSLEDIITHIILTHSHVDHCGNAKHYQDLGAKIIAGKGDVDYLCKAGGFNMFRETVYEENAYHIFPAFTPDIMISEDQEMVLNDLTFRFINIPGHTVGSIAILLSFEEKTILFTGDSISPEGNFCEEVNLGWHGDPKYNSADLINSMLKLVNLDTDMVLGGHGSICLNNGTNVLRKAAKTAFISLR